MANSIPIFWLYILIVCIRVSIFFYFFLFFFAKSLVPSLYIRWLIFSCDVCIWSEQLEKKNYKFQILVSLFR